MKSDGWGRGFFGHNVDITCLTRNSGKENLSLSNASIHRFHNSLTSGLP
jgi:hypothetical protein